MHEKLSTTSTTVMSYSLPPFKRQDKKKAQSRVLPIRNCPQDTDERSPNATSEPIFMPGHKSAVFTRRCAPAIYLPRETRIHHALDNVADYGRSGWGFAQRELLERSEQQVGKILVGHWVPHNLWRKSKVLRKDVDFEKKRIDSGLELSGNDNKDGQRAATNKL